MLMGGTPVTERPTSLEVTVCVSHMCVRVVLLKLLKMSFFVAIEKVYV